MFLKSKIIYTTTSLGMIIWQHNRDDRPRSTLPKSQSFYVVARCYAHHGGGFGINFFLPEENRIEIPLFNFDSEIKIEQTHENLSNVFFRYPKLYPNKF